MYDPHAYSVKLEARPSSLHESRICSLASAELCEGQLQRSGPGFMRAVILLSQLAQHLQPLRLFAGPLQEPQPSLCTRHACTGLQRLALTLHLRVGGGAGVAVQDNVEVAF